MLKEKVKYKVDTIMNDIKIIIIVDISRLLVIVLEILFIQPINALNGSK